MAANHCLANIRLLVQLYWGTDHVEVGIVFRHCRCRRGLARLHRGGSGRGQHREIPVRAVPDLVRGIPRARFYRDEENSRLAAAAIVTFAAGAAEIAKILFYIFLVVFVVAVLLGVFRT